MKTKTTAELFYIRHDLTQTIAVQERTGREQGYHLVPKLGAYQDELFAVLGEIKRRQNYTLVAQGVEGVL